MVLQLLFFPNATSEVSKKISSGVRECIDEESGSSSLSASRKTLPPDHILNVKVITMPGSAIRDVVSHTEVKVKIYRRTKA